MEKTSSSKTTSSHSSQPSIRSFFQPKSQPQYAASAPSSPATATTSKRTPPEGDEPTTDASIELQPTIKSPPAPIPPPLPTPSVPTTPQQQLRFKLPTLPPPPSLHPQATIASITASHIPALRRINSLLLQVVYPDSFYSNILNPAVSGLFSRVILWSDSPSAAPKVIGSLVIRTEDIPASSSQNLYIQSITLLSPYRHLGLATAALEHVLSSAQLSSLSPDSGWDIRGIYAHVWTENHEGLEWYRNRGFKWNEGSPIKGYYHRLRPDTALIVRRDLSMAEQDGQSKGVQHTMKEIETRVKSSVLAGALNLPGFTPAPPTAPPPMIGGAAPPNQDKKEEKDVPTPPSGRPSPPTRPQTVPSLSYQKTRPQTEWNDLPEDMVISNGGPPKALGGPQHLSAPASGSSSRSTSAARKKKERAYPAAAFAGGK